MKNIEIEILFEFGTWYEKYYFYYEFPQIEEVPIKWLFDNTFYIGKYL